MYSPKSIFATLDGRRIAVGHSLDGREGAPQIELVCESDTGMYPLASEWYLARDASGKRTLHETSADALAWILSVV